MGYSQWGWKELDTTERLTLSLSLDVQWLRLCTSTLGSIPGQGTKMPHAMQCSQKKKKKNCSCSSAAVPKLFGTRNQFCGRQFFHRLGECFRMIQTTMQSSCNQWLINAFDSYFLDDLMMLSIFSCAYWPFVHLHWKEAYSNPLPTFNSGCVSLVQRILTEWKSCFCSAVHINRPLDATHRTSLSPGSLFLKSRP